MELQKLYNLVMTEFENDQELALMVVSFHTIHLVEKIKLSDFKKEGKFANRIIEKFKKRVWQQNRYKIDLAINIGLSIYDYEIKESMQGIGGCKFKRLSDIVKDK